MAPVRGEVARQAAWRAWKQHESNPRFEKRVQVFANDATEPLADVIILGREVSLEAVVPAGTKSLRIKIAGKGLSRANYWVLDELRLVPQD